ncbi:50S ribosomal protein L17 [Candidatus Giovannonibacteria bacterium]|nr:50S ribosomal protein L17 [Candidatus Giovannonibacteria bacterium]
MRHQRAGRKFGRVRKVRRAFFKSLLRSLILKEKIITTEARAKEIRPKVEKLVTKAKRGDLASRRLVISETDNKTAIRLFSAIAPRFQERHGGYTRITKLPRRKSDNSPRAIIEFVK